MIIRAATQADLTTIIPELGKTFVADPSLGWILREADDPQGILEAFYGAVSEHALSVGCVDVAEEDGEFLGASIWMPPGERLPLKVLRKSLPAVKKIGKAVPTLVKYLYASSKVSLPFPSWHLEIIVVNERARGRGVGSQLLDHGIERVGADAARLEATSQRAAKLYASRGFIVLGEVKTPAPTPEIIMWRPASSPYVPDRS